MSKEQAKPSGNSVKTVATAEPPPVASEKPKQVKVTVDGESNVYEAANNVEAWAMHNDKNKTQYTVKQKSPKFEDVK